MGAVKHWLMEQQEQALEGERGPCPYESDPATCHRCRSQDPDVFWDSCANADTRDALDYACSKGD